MCRLILSAVLVSSILLLSTDAQEDGGGPMDLQFGPPKMDMAMFGTPPEGQGAPPLPANVTGSGNVVGSDDASPKNQITHGYDSSPGSYPYVAVILIKYYGYYYHICSGVIINSHTILTAAHCFYYYYYYEYYVAVGIHDLRLGLSNRGSQLVKVDHYVIHENYDPYAPGNPNDIAVAHVDCRIKYNYRVKPAPLATKYDGKFTNSYCVIVGWGWSENGREHILQKAYTFAISNYHCSLFWAVVVRAKIHTSHICNYRYPVSTCHGDGGGPLICRGRVAGLISWGRYDCSGCMPGVASRISSYKRWIKKNSGLH